MGENHLEQQIQSYYQWKQELVEAIEAFQDWLDEHDEQNGEHALRIFETLEALRGDRLNIAFVAEFSRGKTELINAIFFANYQRRLLPSEPGRTTMCPTELFYDRKADKAYVRLLPIETRLQPTSIGEYKQDPIYWTTIPLELDDPDQMEQALREVIHTKRVSRQEAERLGLYSKELHPHLNQQAEPPDEVEIPVWRHAMISFPHPLLKQGLAILDTPGLNALGSEPELTMHMLPAAQAILFLLAADTGVTRSDLDIWQYHVGGTRRARTNRNIAVVLNKIDTLWDELRDDDAIRSSVESQIDKTAKLLGVGPDYVFPVSAQKGLLAKVRDDGELLERSALPVLEAFLSDTVLPARESILRDHVMRELGGLLDEHMNVVDTRKQSVDKQLAELQGLSGKNSDVIVHLMKRTREEQTAYQKSVESFQASRRLMQRQAQVLLETLKLDDVDRIINDSRQAMSGSWTTAGLKRGMRNLFDELQRAMDQACEQVDQSRKLISAIYRKFNAEHGLPEIAPRILSLDQYAEQLGELFEEAEAFRKSPVTTMTEQGFVIKKFFISLVSQARNVFFKANREAEAWLKEAMNPLVAQIREHKQMMERRLKTLRKISESRDTLAGKIKELEEEQATLDRQLYKLRQIHQSLARPSPVETSSAA